MGLQAANHYEIAGKGIDGTVDTTGITGRPVVSLTVDGRELAGATLAITGQGIVVDAVVDEIFDKETHELRLHLPVVNLADEATTFAGLAILITARTSFGGPGLVEGPLHLFEVRPISGTASIVES